MGSITIGAMMNEVDSQSGVVDADAEATVLNVAFAF
jgi:hypothetical protein